mgnify:CR=1 FL=1
MALRTIRVQGDPVLEKVCKPVKEMTPKIGELIEDMLDTMYDAQGVGLAAPQVTYIMHDLKEKGLPVKVNVTTVEEAADEIMQALEKKI